MGFSDLGKKLSKLGQDTKNGVQKVSDSVTISNRISQEKKSLERLFALIGEAVYKENPDLPRAGTEDEWAAAKVAYANIAVYTEQLNHIKGIVYCPTCGRPAASGDKYCAKCGVRLDIRLETTGAKVAKDLKEAGQEVGRIAGSAADRTGEAVGGAAAQTQNAFTWLKGKLVKKKNSEEPVQEKGWNLIPQETDEAKEPQPEVPLREEASLPEVPLPEEPGDGEVKQPKAQEGEGKKQPQSDAEPVLAQAHSRNRRQKSAWKQRQWKS